MLRSYDPQIGRFLQNDPYDQFASGYVGMGNDPGNNVDPSGGFSGPGIGCAATAGMSGFGGMAGFLNAGAGIGGVLSSAASIGSIAMRGINFINNLHQQQSNAINGSSLNGTNLSGISSTSDGNFLEGSSPDDCNCPPGYATMPKPGGDPQPYFFDANDAARYWAYKMRSLGATSIAEFSSEIFSFSVGSGSSKVVLFGSTNPVRFPMPKDAYRKSPGVGDPLHGTKPKGAKVIGHIHYHWMASESKSKLTSSDNRTFSEPDKDIHKLHPEKYMYVLGSSGTLYVKYPNDLPLNNGFPNPDEGQIRPLEGSYFDDKKKKPSLCGCYKQ